MSTDSLIVTDTTETPAKAKAKGWPKGKARTPKPAPVNAPTFSTEQFEQLLAVMAGSRQEGAGLDATTLKGILEGVSAGTAKAMQKAMKPENTAHPDMSCFNKPRGERDDPKVKLPFELFWNGYPVHMFPETEHWREMELYAALQPGEFPVMRKDGTQMTVSIKGVKNAEEVLTKLTVEFPVSREEKWLVPPTQVTLYQLVHRDRPLRQAFMEGMQEYFGLIFGGATGTGA